MSGAVWASNSFTEPSTSFSRYALVSDSQSFGSFVASLSLSSWDLWGGHAARKEAKIALRWDESSNINFLRAPPLPP